MPRGQKSKLRTREKRRQARDVSQSHRRVQAIAAIEEPPSSSSTVLEDDPQSSSATESNSTSQGSLKAPSTITTSLSTFGTRPDKDDNSLDDEHPSSSNVSPSTEGICSDTLTSKVSLLEQFLLYKYKMKQPIMKEDMLKMVHQNYHDQFDEILKKASERIETVFAVDVKEVDSTSHCYDLVSKLKLPNNGRVRPGRGLPKTGLLMTILGVIFMKGNCAAEEDIWRFLNMIRVYAGRKHFIYGEPRKLITKDLVRLKYLEYRQVPDSDPPRFEFLWGPKAHAETSKMKVLEFLAKVNDTVPSAFPSQYKEALQDEEERARVAARCPHLLTSCLYSFLLSLMMPQSHKTKHHADEKCHQAQDETLSCEGAQATAVAEEESTPSSPQCGGIIQSLPAAGSCSISQGPQTTTSASISSTRSDDDSNGQPDDRAIAFAALPYSESSGSDFLTRKAGLLEQFLLYKYKMKQPIMKEDMLKMVHQNYHDRFVEILKKASERIEMVFAVDVKEVDSTSHYDLVSKLKLPNNGRVRAGRGLPKTGLLMNLLGMIFIKGNCAAEEDIWRFLSMMGPTLKPAKKVLEFLAKVNDTVPSAFPSYYEEALRDEEERAEAMHSQG
nr:LOW QUALITY PROTEIN: melanoma-associated antigen B3-like [Camelus dromedarius]